MLDLIGNSKEWFSRDKAHMVNATNVFTLSNYDFNGMDWRIHLSLCVTKPTIWIPTRSNINQPVQSQKMDRDLIFCI